jgi:hypothetical protein
MAGGWPGHVMLSDCSGVNPAAEIYQNAYAAGRADIDAQDNVAHHSFTARGA